MGLMLDLQPSAGPALVVGAGTVAARKVKGLLAAGFEVVVVAPEVGMGFGKAGLRILARAFEEGDLAGAPRYAVVFACTNDRAVNRRVGELAKAAGIPVVVADAGGEGTAFTPAVLRDGPVTVAVSTGGEAPRVAAEVRDCIREALGEGWGRAAAKEGKLRRSAREGAP
jgi:siroheme synthase-like protein